ncbi:MAG: enoyl-CoA hydratase/isomerase family protein [Deltaproteobacteria bacterium]|nr:MAG: enoyl-CoA hydratase/isomerase family protein [Deltaproteobacteria bacterium]
MTYNTILIDHVDHVGVITLNRPEQLNTFSTELGQELNRALIELDNNQETRVVIIKGEGKAFSAGIDISEFFGKSQREYYQWVSQMEQMNMVISYMKKPVIACAKGFAVANGAGLIAACDLAVVSEGIKIGATAINVGLFCMGPAVPMSRSLGRKRCLEMLLTGDLIDARTAERWGLVNKVVPEDELDSAAMDLAKKLAAKSPIALQMGKQTYYGMCDMEFSKALEYSNEKFAALCITEDAKEGVNAFLEKRDPVWKEK